MTNFSAANLREMLVMQNALNEQVFKAHGPGTEQKAMKNLTMAMIDEIGELTHELKANWCWWKKTQAPIQPDKVLEEYVDVFHFVMTKVLADDTFGPDYFIEGFKFGTHAGADILDPVSHIRSLIGCTTSRGLGANMALLMRSIGLNFKQVYECYLQKHAVNEQRIQEGY